MPENILTIDIDDDELASEIMRGIMGISNDGGSLKTVFAELSEVDRQDLRNAGLNAFVYITDKIKTAQEKAKCPNLIS